jgi:hypothetical protein
VNDEASTDRRVNERARELLRGGSEGRAPVAEDESEASLAARRILEESDERTSDPAATDPEDENVIRRSSEETS